MIVDMLTDNLMEVYEEGLRDGLRALLACINHFKDIKGEYPDMEEFAENLLPRMIDDIPEILRTRGGNRTWN